MTFPGKFTDQLIADKLDRVSLSFLVDDLAIRRGGVAANIAFGLGEAGLPFAADPSQQLARILGDEQVRTLVDGADYLFGNEYEEALIERKSGWGGAEMLARVGVRITTLGSAGAKIERRGEPTISVPAVPDAKPVDPTGSGDPFRSGSLRPTPRGPSPQRAAPLGNLRALP